MQGWTKQKLLVLVIRKNELLKHLDKTEIEALHKYLKQVVEDRFVQCTEADLL